MRCTSRVRATGSGCRGWSDDGEPANGWFVHAGTACVGSRAMLDEGQSLTVTVTGQYDGPAAGDRAGWAEDTELAATGLTGGGWPPPAWPTRASGPTRSSPPVQRARRT